MAKRNGATVRITPEGARAIFGMLDQTVYAAGRNIAGRVPAEIASANSENLMDRNGRPVAMVALTEPNGLAIQAKHGTLTRSAAEEGADVHRYPRGR
jgi:hypothetical protein